MGSNAGDETSQAPKKARRFGLTGCLVFFLGIGVLGAIGAMISSPNLPSASQAPIDKAEAEAASKRTRTLALGRQLVTALLKDPGSATFDNDFARSKGGVMVPCGEINGKNSFGALAGMTPWIAIPDQRLVMIRDLENGSRFAGLWNKYCAGPETPSAAPPKEFFGIRFRANVPGALRRFEDSPNVWVFAGKMDQSYHGVLFDQIWFTSDHGRVVGAGATAKGKQAFLKLRDALFEQYGVPTADNEGDKPEVRWDWGKNAMRITLGYNPDHDQVTLSEDIGGE